jgi:hypothetical protein
MKLCHLQENDETGDHHVVPGKPSPDRQIPRFHSYVISTPKNNF